MHGCVCTHPFLPHPPTQSNPIEFHNTDTHTHTHKSHKSPLSLNTHKNPNPGGHITLHAGPALRRCENSITRTRSVHMCRYVCVCRYKYSHTHARMSKPHTRTCTHTHKPHTLTQHTKTYTAPSSSTCWGRRRWPSTPSGPSTPPWPSPVCILNTNICL